MYVPWAYIWSFHFAKKIYIKLLVLKILIKNKKNLRNEANIRTEEMMKLGKSVTKLLLPMRKICGDVRLKKRKSDKKL